MAKIHWKEKFSKGGVCDFRENYDFYFKWLLNKVSSCFVLKNLPETINATYLKTNLILDGNICITKFGDKLYACQGNVGGMPNEYYIPQDFIIANPILGSKVVRYLGDNPDGVVITNTAIDSLYSFDLGLFDLINQTATLLADNIISISCCQINSRVTAFFTGESDSQCLEGETVLKQMYAGRPYQVLRSDIVEKLNVNPMSNSSTGQTLTSLVELHNYIIGNFFQSIGIKSNNIRKKAHVLNEEIDSQNEFLKISIMEILTSWTEGFNKVNELYGTNIEVELNPALVETVIDDESSDFSPETKVTETDSIDNTETDNSDTETETETETTDSAEIPSETDNSPIETITDEQEQVEEIVELAMDSTESEATDNDQSEDESTDATES